MSYNYCDSCKTPAPLECVCCYKEKAILQSLLKRLNAYQCYLRPILIGVSEDQLSKSALATTTATVVGGFNTKFGLNNVFNTAASPIKLRIPLLVGCYCSRLSVLQKLYYHDVDGYGFASTGNTLEIEAFLSNTFSASANTEAVNLIKNTGTTNGPTVRAIRGATIIVEESKRIFNAMLEALQC